MSITRHELCIKLIIKNNNKFIYDVSGDMPIERGSG